MVKWGKGMVRRTANAVGEAVKRGVGEREIRDVFELKEASAFRRFYEAGIFVWLSLYRGLYRPWHVIPAPSVANPNGRREMYRLNAPKAVCAELAGMVWGEEAGIRVNSKGWKPRRDAAGAVGGDPLDEFVQAVLKRNAFYERTQAMIESALALGGAAVKVWGETREQATGNREQGNREDAEPAIRIGYCMADQFVPLSWDSARVYEGVFISRRERGGYRYTRLEWHERDGGMYRVRNELYRSEAPNGAPVGEEKDILGVRCPLAEVYPELDEETEIETRDSLFSYFRTPIANNLDPNSPLGMSVYGNALETLRALDICYDSFVSEFRLGKKRIIVPARCVRMVADPQTGQLRRYFDATDETYEAFAADDADGLKIVDNSVELRVEEHVAALNAFLSVLCLQLGFSANTFSFDRREGLRTATEVVSENSKTFKTVRTVQNQLRPAFEHMVKNIIDVAALYGVKWRGQSVERLAAGGYEVKVVFDDGVKQDRQTNIDEGIRLVGAGLLSRFTFLTDRKYGQGLTAAEAAAELARIREEQRTTVMEEDETGAKRERRGEHGQDHCEPGV